MQNQEVRKGNADRVLPTDYSLGLYFVGFIWGCTLTLAAVVIFG